MHSTSCVQDGRLLLEEEPGLCKWLRADECGRVGGETVALNSRSLAIEDVPLLLLALGAPLVGHLKRVTSSSRER